MIDDNVISENSYVTILPFMVKELKLSRISLIIYAIIYGYSNNDNGCFYGSIEYLASWSGSSERAVRLALDSLIEKKLITKTDRPGRPSIYRAETKTDKQKKKQPRQKLPGSTEETTPAKIADAPAKIADAPAKIADAPAKIADAPAKIADDIKYINKLQEKEKKEEKLFLSLWQHHPKIFNTYAGIEKFKDFENFFETSGVTCQEIQKAVDNVIASVDSGALDIRFIPKTPDRFILGGWINKYQKPPGKDPPENYLDRFNYGVKG
ncbi:hypothetical protein FACS1894124_5070 [Spirochaetia bacterium]|nr:hypothetical protein FACS1894124_5070 [Spirochaetia bacterium]